MNLQALAKYGTHMPILAQELIRALMQSHRRLWVLEHGCGEFSTEFIVSMSKRFGCIEHRAIENNPQYRVAGLQYLDKEQCIDRCWDLILVDGDQHERQWVIDNIPSKVYVVHDTEMPSIYGYDFEKFNNISDYKELTPWTTVLRA